MNIVLTSYSSVHVVVSQLFVASVMLELGEQIMSPTIINTNYIIV